MGKPFHFFLLNIPVYQGTVNIKYRFKFETCLKIKVPDVCLGQFLKAKIRNGGNNFKIHMEASWNEKIPETKIGCVSFGDTI